MSGGGFILSRTSKVLLILVVLVLAGFSVLSFIKAFPFDNVFTSILLLLLGLALLLIAFFILVLILISK